MALESWVEARRPWVAARRRENVEGVLRAQAIALPLPPSFNDAVRIARTERALIAGIMRRDPGTGRTLDVDIATFVPRAESLGACAFAVYPDEELHGGSYADILAVAQCTGLPVLSRDPVIDPVQIVMARTHGAAAVTLCVGALSDNDVRTLFRQALELGLDVVFEVGSAAELDRLARVRVSGPESAGAGLVAVHAVGFDGKSADLPCYERLVEKLPEAAAGIAAAGICDETDAAAVVAMGYDAFVAPYLSLADDVEASLRALAGDRI